ncbi:MAG: hypothetical protein Tsb0027_12030 [Wenzhouxiangellaceae bacterium]
MFALPLNQIRAFLLISHVLLLSSVAIGQEAETEADDATSATATPASAADNSSGNDSAVTPAAAPDAPAAAVQTEAGDSQQTVAADLPALTLVAQPIYPQYLASSVYTPLADYLATGLQRDIELITPKNFQAHWSAIKSGVKHDLALEEAPLTDYRIRYQQYQPLVQAAASQSYALAVLDGSYEDRFDLVGRPVASLAAPSSAYLFLTRWYDNPLSQPVIISTATSYEDAVQQLWGGEVEGVVLPAELATDYPQFSFIATSDSMPGLAISAAPELPPELVEQLQQLLLGLNQAEHIAILDELNVAALEAADAERFNGYAEWIRSVSYTGFD